MAAAITAMLCSSASALVKPISVDEFIEVVPQRLAEASRSIELIAKGEDVLVVFVPGILGSRLTDPLFDRAVLWGENGAPNLRDLVFRGEPAKAALLERYPTGVLEVDVYGGIRQKLIRIVGRKIVFEGVAYDWRSSLISAADQLDGEIRRVASKHPKRRLVLIAHSMGGLVAWAWLNRHWLPSQESYPDIDEITRVWLIGSPVHGSCEMLRMLVQGYLPDLEAGAVERFGYRMLFGEMHAAVFTFPSVLQLLPSTKRRMCVETVHGSTSTPRDHFALETWRDHILPAVRVKDGGFWVARVPPWEKLRMSRDHFLSILDHNLAQARAFREELDNTTHALSTKARFFYSYDMPTTQKLRLRDGAASQVAERDGDGRVRGDDARLSLHDEPSYQVSGDHDGILSSDQFLRFVDEKIAAAANDQKAGRMAERIAASVDLLVAYGERVGRVLPIDELRFPPGDPRTGEMIKAIAKVNVATFTGQVGPRHVKAAQVVADPRVAAAEAYDRLARGMPGVSEAGEAALYASIDALWLPTETAQRIELKIRYGDSLRRSANRGRADAVYQEAFREASRAMPEDSEGEFGGQLRRIGEGIRALELPRTEARAARPRGPS